MGWIRMGHNSYGKHTGNSNKYCTKCNHPKAFHRKRKGYCLVKGCDCKCYEYHKAKEK